MAQPQQALRVVFTLLLATLVAGCSIGAQTVGLPGLPPGGTVVAPHVPGEVLVRVMPAASKAEVASAVGAVVLGEIPRITVLRLRLVGGGSVADAIRTLQGRADVLYAEPNYLAFASLVPNDPAYPGKLWGLVKIGAASAWDTTSGASTVVVAVLDTGVDAAHPDLGGKVLPGANCVTLPCVPGGAGDAYGHGTHVAGTAGALGNNGIGIVGVAFNSATQILPVKVLSDAGEGSFAGIAAGIVWAADAIVGMGKKGVLNMSLGGFGYSQALQDAVAYAIGAGQGSVLVVAAMGNEFKRYGIFYPAALTGVMAAGATDGNDAKVDFSNTGLHISVGAPGRDVYSTIPGGSYAYYSGTSMASPHVAGLAALVWSAFPGFSNYQVRRKIEATAADLGAPGWDESFGWGRISAAAAVVGGTPAPYYGCAAVLVQAAGPTPQPGSDVVVTSGTFRRTTKSGPGGFAVLDFLPAGTYSGTASKVIGGTAYYGTASLLVAATGPSCSGTTITMVP